MRKERITEYGQAMEYRELLREKGVSPGLDSIRRLSAELGNPQDGLRIVHIAGTNGKGSVGCFLSAILKRAGYRTGRYFSPAVFAEREIIQVNGRPISKADFVRGMEAVRAAAERMEEAGRPYPTLFEAETALSFWYFRERLCDIVVLETGMGGRLDATNIVSGTVAAVLTQIGMDHVGALGNSLEEIASHKAGIIKNGCYVISAAQETEAATVIKAECERHNAPLRIVDMTDVKKIRYGLEKQSFSYGGYERLEISLAGTYQIENAALAVETVGALKERGCRITEKALRRGLLEAKWRGRFTVLARRPLFIIDGAHNESAARKLRESVIFHFTNRKIITIMGILKDKDYEKIVELTAPLASQVITVTPPRNKRAFPAYELAGVVRRYNPNVTAADSLQEAVEMSYLLADGGSVILALGSLSYLGELTKIVEHRDRIRRDAHGRS